MAMQPDGFCQLKWCRWKGSWTLDFFIERKTCHSDNWESMEAIGTVFQEFSSTESTQLQWCNIRKIQPESKTKWCPMILRVFHKHLWRWDTRHYVWHDQLHHWSGITNRGRNQFQHSFCSSCRKISFERTHFEMIERWLNDVRYLQ